MLATEPTRPAAPIQPSFGGKVRISRRCGCARSVAPHIEAEDCLVLVIEDAGALTEYPFRIGVQAMPNHAREVVVVAIPRRFAHRPSWTSGNRRPTNFEAAYGSPVPVPCRRNTGKRLGVRPFGVLSKALKKTVVKLPVWSPRAACVS